MADRFEQGFLRDEAQNLVVTGGDGVTAKMDYGFVRDEDTRALVVVGPDGTSIGASGVGVSKYDPVTETWEPRPNYPRVVFVSPVKGAPDPLDMQEFDEKVEPAA